MATATEHTRPAVSDEQRLAVGVPADRMPATAGRANVRRAAGIVFGLATQLVFLVTVWELFWFLKGDATDAPRGSLWIDAALCLQFAIPHSLLLHPAGRRRLSRWIPSTFYGLFFCCATCSGLWLTFCGWQSSDIVVWQASGGLRIVIQSLFIASWIGLLYSLALNGLGYQTGWTPWWYWLMRQAPPRRGFTERGAYRYLRHPIYLSFLGLLWFTPTVTLDRVVLIGVWSVYIYVGSILKDWRLTYYLGDSYREYAARVAGYPLVKRGPLAKWPARNLGVN